MHSGGLAAVGTSLELKSKYGIGYQLKVLKARATASTDGNGDAETTDASHAAPHHQATTDEVDAPIIAAVQQEVSGAVVLSTNNHELCLQLPLAQVSSFSKVFRLLEADVQATKLAREADALDVGSTTHNDSLGVLGFGLSVTSLEEVFLRLNAECDENVSDADKIATGISDCGIADVGEPESNAPPGPGRRIVKVDSETSIDVVPESSDAPTIWNASPSERSHLRQWKALVLKRWINFKRDIAGALFQLLLPILFVALIMVISIVDVGATGPIMELSANLYATQDFSILCDPNGVDFAAAWLGDANSEQWPMNAKFRAWNESLPQLDSMTLSTELMASYSSHGDSGRYSAYLWSDSSCVLSVPFRVIDGGPRGLWDVAAEAATDRTFETENASTWTVVPVHQVLRNLGLPINQMSLLHNASAKHAVPAFITEQIRRLMFVDSADTVMPAESYFHVRSEALPLTAFQSFSQSRFLDLIVGLFLLIPFSYLPAAFATFVVQERVCKSTHLQRTSGVLPITYWTSTLVWDFCQYSAICLATVLLMLAFQSEPFVGTWSRAASTIVLFLLYGLSAIPLSYLLSFCFTNAAAAQVGITVINFLVGFMLVMLAFQLNVNDITEDVMDSAGYAFRMSPPFNLGDTFITIATADVLNSVNRTTGDAIAWDEAGQNYLQMALTAVLFFGLVMLVDSDACRRRQDFEGFLDADDTPMTTPATGMRAAEAEAIAVAVAGGDDDVVREAQRIVKGETHVDDVIVLDRLRKVYAGTRKCVVRCYGCLGCCCCCPKHVAEMRAEQQARRVTMNPKSEMQGSYVVAVRRLSLGMQRGECFGLLGVNGAGKTSTLKMLTGDVGLTNGKATVSSLDVGTQIDRIQAHLGYCPQFDPLLGRMTGRETLEMFASLKGVPVDLVKSGVETVMRDLGLWEYRDRMCGGYSGGNKRKLSLGIALIGNPRVVVLDEPSTGMDPIARRRMWNVVASQTSRSCVVLTSHSMEECEALCTRVGIMTGGNLRCLGGVQHLKSKHGQGYLLELSGRDVESAERIKTYLAQELPEACLYEQFGAYLRYSVSHSRSDIARTMREGGARDAPEEYWLSRIFAVIEANKERLHVTQYSLSQPTLEQVFVRIAGSKGADRK